MRMMPLVAVAVALGLSFMILGGLGVTDWFGNTGESGLENEVGRSAGSAGGDLDPQTGDDGGFFSFVVGALRQVRGVIGVVLFLPSTFRSMGAPDVVAEAIGRGIQLVVAIGMVQVAIQWEVR